MIFDISNIGEVFKDIREAITGKQIENPEKLQELQKALYELELAAMSGQIAVNVEEAKNSNLFVSGWRPFIGWVCGVALAYNFIIHPLILWYVTIAGYNLIVPKLDSGMLFDLVLAMLGLGGLRTYEKLRGVASINLKGLK